MIRRWLLSCLPLHKGDRSEISAEASSASGKEILRAMNGGVDQDVFSDCDLAGAHWREREEGKVGGPAVQS